MNRIRKYAYLTVLVIISIFLLSCDESSISTTGATPTTEVTTMMEATITTVVASTTTENVTTEKQYSGPLFLGLAVFNQLPENVVQLSHKRYAATTGIPVTKLSIGDEGYTTTVNTAEYLVIYIEQPTEAIDKYPIFSIVIDYPDGTSRLWQAGVHEIDGDVNSREWYINNDITEIYIPVTTLDTPSESTYTVTSLTYLNGAETVKWVEGAVDSIILYVGNHALGCDSEYNITGNLTYYGPTDTYYLNFGGISNIDNAEFNSITIYGLDSINNVITSVTLEYDDIYVGGYSENYTTPLISYLSDGVTARSIIVPSDVIIDLNLQSVGFIKYELEYYDGFGGTQVFVTYGNSVVHSEIPFTAELNVKNGWEMTLIDSNFIGSIHILNDIIIPEYFNAFTSSRLVLFGDNVRISFEDTNEVFYNMIQSDTLLAVSHVTFETLIITSDSLLTNLTFSQEILNTLINSYEYGELPSNLTVITTLEE